MSDVIAPTKKVTFTIKKSPRRVADVKTIQRLMLMQRSIQNGLRKLSKRRKRHDNYTSPRAGRMWMTRMPTTKIARVEKGATFTLTITAQLMPDIKAVEKYLDAKPAK
jgi:hypothetical protein